MSDDFVFSSESVTEGHPDKLCDQISDAIVDRFLHQDPRSRVAAECAVSTGILFIAAHFASEGSLDVPGLAREVVRDIGYEEDAFDARTCSIMTSLNELPLAMRAPDERHLDETQLDRLRAGDQVTVFGFACRHTPSLMPLPVALAHALARRLAGARREGALPWLGADCKTQVGVAFHERRPQRIHTVSVLATQCREGAPPLPELREAVRENVIRPVFAEQELEPDDATRILVNPDGEALLGGPSRHSGLTGRKNGVDLYGEYARHSSAALSGKDPTRVDRLGAYAARHAAKNVVAAGLAEECEVQLSYTVGLAEPVSLQVLTYGTGQVPEGEISRRLREACDFRVGGILQAFDIRRLPAQRKGTFFRKLAAYGHVGREELDLPWERLDLLDALA